jgi:hypothetical protein
VVIADSWLGDTGDLEDEPHPMGGELGIRQETGPVGEE